MKPEEMMDTIGKIDDEHIEEFAQVRPRRFLIPWGMVATVAAFCLVIGTAVFLRSAGIFPHQTTPPDTTPPITTAPPSTGETTAPPTTTAPPETTQAPTQPFRPSGTRMMGAPYERLTAALTDEGSMLHTVAESMKFLTPQDISLGNFIRHTYRPADDFTADEASFLQNAGFGIYLDGGIRRAHGAEVRQLLAEYFGITPEQLSISPYELLVYWEETDCYYVCEHGMHADFAAHSAYMQENGLIHLYYNTAEKATQLPEYVMILQPTDTGYRVLANWEREETDLANASAIQTLVPRMDPQIPAGEGPVFDRWTLKSGWSSEGTQYGFTIRVPALQPDSEGAVQINKEIQESLHYTIESLQSGCDDGRKPYYMSVDYETWMIGDIRVVQLIEVTYNGDQRTEEFYLDTVTGECLDDAALAGLSHLEWLYRCCSMLKTCIGEGHRDGCGLFVSTRPDQNGQLILSHNCLAVDAPPPVKLRFDPNAGELTELADMYHWFFNIHTDGAFATQWSTHLWNVFFEDPAVFVQMLAKEDAETVEDVAALIWFEMRYEDLPRYLEQVTEIRDLTSNTKVAETAQIMLDSPAASSTLALDNILRYYGAFSMVTDRASALENSKVLHDLCMEYPANFISYMTNQDERYYGFYWQAVLADCTLEERQALYDAAMKVITSPYYFSKQIWSARLLLKML